MSRIFLFSVLVFLSGGALSSCSDNDDKAMPVELPVRLQTETEYYDNALEEYSVYQYDNLGRALEVSTIFGADDAMSTKYYLYSDSLVLGYEYSTFDDIPYIETHYLNGRGLADSTVFRYDGQDRAVIRYLYNNQGYKVRSEFASKQFAMYFEDQYQYENGNMTRLVMKMVFGTPDPEALSVARLAESLRFSPSVRERLLHRIQSCGQQIREQELFQDTLYYEYLPQRNTLSDHNRGLLFQGRPNTNLVSKYTIQNGPDREVYTYEYLFDGKGRAIKQYEPDGESAYMSDFSYTE
ncbi:MAG: hypothetical protein AB7C90_04280 [Bacteroidales bacterium]